MLFPISDDDSDFDGPAIVTWTLLALNVVVYFAQVKNPALTAGWSMIPYEITTGTDLVGNGHATGPSPIHFTLLSSMFMHGGLFHLLGNMLYLWIFADNLEHVFGKPLFILFYLTCGIAGSFTQIAMGPDVMIPNLGASGAIAGVLGAYLVLFPGNRVNVVLFLWFFIRTFAVPAVVVIGVWIAFQLIAGYGSLSFPDSVGGVAYGAHIGGFAAGALLGLLARGSSK